MTTDLSQRRSLGANAPAGAHNSSPPTMFDSEFPPLSSDISLTRKTQRAISYDNKQVIDALSKLETVPLPPVRPLRDCQQCGLAYYGEDPYYCSEDCYYRTHAMCEHCFRVVKHSNAFIYDNYDSHNKTCTIHFFCSEECFDWFLHEHSQFTYMTSPFD